MRLSCDATPGEREVKGRTCAGRGPGDLDSYAPLHHPESMLSLDPMAALANAVVRQALARPPDAHPAGLADAVLGLHATDPVTPYLTVLARMARFRRTMLDDLMWASWELVRFRAMRCTLFVMPHELLEVAASATRSVVQPMRRRWVRDSGLTAAALERWMAAIEEALQDGPQTVRALRTALDVPGDVDLSGIVGLMCDEARLVGGRPPRSWTSSVRTYHLWSQVLGDVDPFGADPVRAMERLVAAYVRSYGPVTLDDVAWWTGLAKNRCREALSALGSTIQEVAVDRWGGPLYMERSATTRHLDGQSVRALPVLDPYVQGYRDRARFLDPARHDHVYDAGGNATATLVQSGRIIGVWQRTKQATILFQIGRAHV